MATSEVQFDSTVGAWTIEFVSEAGVQRQRFLRRGEQLILGSREDVDLRLQDRCVSAVHCRLEASELGLRVVDLGSKNGVHVGGAKVSEAKLGAFGGAFTIGRTTLRVRPTGRREEDVEWEPISGMVGRSEPMLRLVGQIRRLAKLRAPVLILGESGVGKDVVAQALHKLSERSGLYVPLNVATVPESLSDSELFGHCRGAFTGAQQARVGAFEQAHGGTLFLDEIGELAPVVQAKLLRILEDGLVRPVGAPSARKVDVRVVSATCAPLGERCANGQFRFDLLQRLSMVVLEVPPLRERKSDIPQLVHAWLKRFRNELGARSLSNDALARLAAYEWPGNVRELGGVVYRACIGTEDDMVDASAVERALSSQARRTVRRGSDPTEYLTLAEGNVSLAARLAGLPRTTFRTWLSRARREAARGHAHTG